MSPPTVTHAEVVLRCDDLTESLPFFIDRLGFRIESIYPADAPVTAVLSGHGIRLRLQPGADLHPGMLRIEATQAPSPAELVAPNGTRIEFAGSTRRIDPPTVHPGLIVARAGEENTWVTGRAGMQYRDLIPGRLGGRFIASHIRIEAGGPVPDYVHHHDVRFQMIYCRRGWVRVVYEDQGSDFVMRPGDCVLQPPGIRHRVLESSAGTEVVEIGSPAEHITYADHHMTLPTAAPDPQREFGGQRFVLHRASTARWSPWRIPGFVAADTGIAAATGGVAGVCVARPQAETAALPWSHDGELLFIYVLRGRLSLSVETDGDSVLHQDDAVVVPAKRMFTLRDCSADLELMEVTLPAQLL